MRLALNKKLVAFDMDGTLISGRLVFALADRGGVSDKVREIMRRNVAGYMRSAEIARLWRGLKPDDVTDTVASIPLMNNANEVVEELKKAGHKVGIISDSYTLATDYISKKMDMDFHFSNILVERDGLLTGDLHMPMGWDKIGCDCLLSVCKRFHLERAASMFSIEPEDTIAIGDTISDLCMIKRAGVGIAFNPKDDLAASVANTVRNLDMKEILRYIH